MKMYVVCTHLNRLIEPLKYDRIFIYSEMRKCFEELDKNDDCRVVVLTGAGKVFSAGIKAGTINRINE